MQALRLNATHSDEEHRPYRPCHLSVVRGALATIAVARLAERGGADARYGIIYPPQVAIIGFGKAMVRPWVVIAVTIGKVITSKGTDFSSVAKLRSANYAVLLERVQQK